MQARLAPIWAFAAAALVACGGSNGNTGSPDGGPTPGDTYSPEAPPTGRGPAGVPPAPEYDDQGIHVSPSGDDTTGNGTPEAPYRHIQYVLDSVAAPGDTLILGGGVYAEEVRIRQPQITLRSKSGELATIQVPVSVDENTAPVAVLFDVDSDGGKLQRVEVVGGFYGVMLQTKWDWGEPADRSGATDITIEDCHIHHTGRDGIKVTPESDRLTIRRSEIHTSGYGYPPGTSLDDKNAEGIDVVNADQVLVQDCYIHDTATTGVYLKGGSRDGRIERTRVERAGALGIVLGFDTSPEFFDLTTNPGYFENVNGVVANCIVDDTGYAGIALYAAENPQVLHNTIRNTATLGHAPLYFGLTYQDWDESALRPATTNALVQGNVIVQPAAATTPCLGIRYSEDLGGLSGLSGPANIDYNVYFRAGSPCTFDDGRPTSLLEGGDLAAWQAGSGGDAHSLLVDPRLTADGHLEAESPCIDQLACATGLGTDIDGEPRAGLCDLGADER